MKMHHHLIFKENYILEVKNDLNFQEYLNYIETVLKYYDLFSEDICSKVFEMLYLNDKSISQLEMAKKLHINQSNVSQRKKKIEEFMIKIINEERYKELKKYLK